MQSITPMFVENLVCSILLSKGIGIEAYKSPSWDSYFQFVKPVRESNDASKPNVQNLPVWRDGRGSFSDYEVDGYFIDWKGYKSQPKLNGRKMELWAGRPSGQKSQNYSWEDMSDEDIKAAVIKEYHDNKEGLQIHESLNDNDRPYIIGFTWPVIDANGKVTPMCQLLNLTKLWSSAGVSTNAIKRKFFVLRVKAVYNKVGSTVVSMSYCARVECKLKKAGAFEHLASIGAITAPFEPMQIQTQLKTII